MKKKDISKYKCEERITSTLIYSFLSIAFLVIVYLAYIFFYYSELASSPKVSSFFSFLSSLGIGATITVYLLQQKTDNKKKKEHIEQIGNFTLTELSKILFSFQELKKNINGLCNTFEDKDASDIEFKHFKDGFYIKKEVYTYYISPFDTTELASLCKYVFNFDKKLYQELSLIELSLISLNTAIIDECLSGTQHSLSNLNNYINHKYKEFDTKHHSMAWRILNEYKDYSKK